jgi:baculoviral IAP repeat-containing protein 7/8
MDSSKSISDCESNSPKLVTSFVQKMNYEKFRIESFRNWPLPYINVKELASNGFYYKGYDDEVECNFCHITLRSWEAEDTGEIQHKRWAPYCPFVKGVDTDNIKIENT